MRKNYLSTFLLLLPILYLSCKKSEYLDAKPNQKLVVPETLRDFQAILDNEFYMNGNSTREGVLPDFLEVGSDDYYCTSAITSRPIAFINLYIWNDDIWSNPFTDWSIPYRSVFYANVVLDGIPGVSFSLDQKDLYNNIKGSALFFRSNTFYHLAQVFAPPFDPSSSNADFGIPLRISSDINEPIKRASVEETYDRIIKDLREAIPLLPTLPTFKTRPSKTAAYALLARVYLAMRDYQNAFLFADSSLMHQGSLLNYNNFNPSDMYPFPRFNNEVIFQALLIRNPINLFGIARVDSTLYNTYATNDLRKSLYFRNNPSTGGYFFRGGYDQSLYLFGGLAVDEMYLIRAECQARKNNYLEAISDLNTLLQKRYATGTFTPISASSSAEALNKILNERRKELVFRGTRWTDLRRLNKEGANIVLTRTFNGQTFSLQPNSPKYTYLIPPSVIGFNPNMQQNPR